ncbi:protein kinase domain-containing protein, partial [Chamaesiphon sp. OTE_20_metabat_361]|uniref:protein kinase domain-containing protein n=1 Tax=Chamaesiphon sp. OTE_20_metabat_361 TaxID=2964689 RepID=UPI00286A8411
MLPIAPDTLLQQRYRILNLLEDDTLGRTYLATDSGRADAYCALVEAIPTAQSPTAVAAAKEFFKREVTPLYQLQHSQIPRFWTTLEEQNRLLIVRDYVAGKTYAQLLAERRNVGSEFTAAEVHQFLTQVLPPIGYAHSKGTIHRNLSPTNIICRDRDRLPVVTNFGVLTDFINQIQSPGNRLAIGQPGYAPAEQVHSGRISPSTDLYALAIAAIVMLTGKDPSALIDGDRIDWNWRKWTQISDEFAAILSRMLSFEPEDRYQSALEVSQALSSAIEPQSIAAPSPPRPSTLQTVAVGGKSIPHSEPSPAAIINVDRKSIWEQPKVFIPAGIAIALLAGLGSWFGVSQLLRRPTDPVATTPPKQVDFNNPTIPTDSSSPSPTTAASDVIQPEMNLSIVKEGTVDATTPIKYRIPALAGQNLDIQLIPALASPTDPTQTTPPTDPANSLSSPIDPLKPSPSQSKNNAATNPPISLPNATTPPTQVLMTILSPTGTPIDDRADRVVGWRGQIPASGDYTIELRPIKGIKGSIFPYKLSVTQVAISPTPTPIPIPSVNPSPSPDSSLPSGTPVPIEGNGIAPTPTNPNPNSAPNNLPSGIDSPAPSVTPTPSESPRPARRRRRNRVQVEPTPQIQRDRSESTEETPTPRRRRQVESTEETPTPRRRRQAESTEETPTPRRRRQPE